VPEATHGPGLDELGAVLDEERELMNFYAPHYRTSLLFNSYYYGEERRHFADWMLRILAGAGRDPATLSYLDAGCGTGELLELLAERGCFRLTGIDIAEEMLSGRNHRRIPGVRLIHGSVEHHDLGAQRFDVIASVLTVHHMYDPGAFFRLVDRHLPVGGWFFVLEYNAAAWAHGRLMGKPLSLLIAPLRRLIKIKNRAALAAEPPIPARFNHAHRLLRFEDLVAAMPRPDAYRVTRYTRGLFLSALNNALVRESGVDATLHELIGAFDKIVEPFGAGYLQGVAGERIR
jgi:SAM-dependent methyltransferase